MLLIDWLLQDFVALRNIYLVNTLSVMFYFQDILIKIFVNTVKGFLGQNIIKRYLWRTFLFLSQVHLFDLLQVTDNINVIDI